MPPMLEKLDEFLACCRSIRKVSRKGLFKKDKIGVTRNQKELYRDH